MMILPGKQKEFVKFLGSERIKALIGGLRGVMPQRLELSKRVKEALVVESQWV